MEKKKIQSEGTAIKLREFKYRISDRLKKTTTSAKFPRRYALASLVILLATTVVWSILGASVQKGNADQLVDTYLFSSSQTIHAASLPGAHTMLLKWPIFWLISYLGVSGASLAFFTTVLTLLTVGALAFVLYRIDRRPLVFGTLCLALASVLLLVPAQPYAGALLPVNMAMVATRNLEYVVYIASLYLLVRSTRLKDWNFWVATLLMAALVASDKLFLSLSVGAALLMLIIYSLRKSWNLVSLSVNWLISSSVAAGLALASLALLNGRHWVHIVNQSSNNPYGLIHSLHQLWQGIAFGFLNLFTNFGANPGYDTTTLKSLPHFSKLHLISPGGPAYVANLVILLAGLYAVGRLLYSGLRPSKRPNASQSIATNLSLMLIASSLVAFTVFIFTNHYYPVDARYLTIGLFAIFVAAATYGRTYKWKRGHLIIGGGLLTLAIVLGLFASARTYNSEKTALNDINQRNSAVASALAQHKVTTLVGDYWRVMPIRLASGNTQQVTPLDNCTQFRQVLSSTVWQPNLKTHSFAYLLSLGRSLTGYPSCSLDQIISAYGRPNASVLVAGKVNQPKEVLLFYDHGAHKSSPTTNLTATPSTVLPITLDALPYTFCEGPTILNIVAHQDDDLLFINPDLLHDISAGHCVRTVYVTAGDAGGNQFYWLNREQGSEAAYSKMLGHNDEIWIKRIVELNDHEFITVASPRGNSRISLVFFHLPDGNVGGNGFAANKFQSLASLWGYHIKTIDSVDNQSNYSYTDLVSALASLMNVYSPAEIRTQANYQSRQFPDHSDHMAVGRFVKLAYAQYETQQFENRVTIPIKFYMGYPAHAFPSNVTSTDLQQKTAAWLEYAKFDGNVCQTQAACDHSPTYGSYLQRQYQNPF